MSASTAAAPPSLSLPRSAMAGEATADDVIGAGVMAEEDETSSVEKEVTGREEEGRKRRS